VGQFLGLLVVCFSRHMGRRNLDWVFGPTVFDVAWLPFLIAGFFITVLLGATIPHGPPYPNLQKNLLGHAWAQNRLLLP
jgi:hypothetical protein